MFHPIAVAVVMALQLTGVCALPQTEFAIEPVELSEQQRDSLHRALVSAVPETMPSEISPFRYVGGIPFHARAILESPAASGPLRTLWEIECNHDRAQELWICDPPTEIRLGSIDRIQVAIEVEGELPTQTLIKIVRWLRDPSGDLSPAAEILQLKFTGNPNGRHRVTARYCDTEGAIHTRGIESNLPRRAGYSSTYGRYRLSEKSTVPDEFSRLTLVKMFQRRYQYIRFGNFVVLPDRKGPLVVSLGLSVSIWGGRWPDTRRFFPITAYRLNGEILTIEPLPGDILERLKRVEPLHEGLKRFLDSERKLFEPSYAVALEFAGREPPSIEEFRTRTESTDPGQARQLWMALGHLYGERGQLDLARQSYAEAQAAIGETQLRLPSELSIDLELAFTVARRLQRDEAIAAAEPVWRVWKRYDRQISIVAYGLPILLVLSLVWPAKKPLPNRCLLVLAIALMFAHAALFNGFCLTQKTGSAGSRFLVANLVADHCCRSTPMTWEPADCTSA